MERRRVPVVLLHEALDVEQRSDALEAQPLGHADLLIARQDVLRLPGFEVELVADPGEELDSQRQRLRVFGGDDAGGPEHLRVPRPVARERDPAEQMDVAHPTGALLDVRLQQVHGGEVVLVLLAAFPDHVVDELGDRRRGDQTVIAALEVGEERLAPDQEPGLRQGRAHRQVLAGEVDRVLRRPHALGELHAVVPEIADQRVDHVLDVDSRLPRAEEQEVDVGVRRGVASAGAAHRDEGQVLQQTGPGRTGRLLHRPLVGLDDDAVVEVRQRRRHLPAERARHVSRADLLAPRAEVFLQVRRKDGFGHVVVADRTPAQGA